MYNRLLPHVLNVSFKGMEVESLLVNLDMAGLCVSSGSACTAGSIDPSHVLLRCSEKMRMNFVIRSALALVMD